MLGWMEEIVMKRLLALVLCMLCICSQALAVPKNYVVRNGDREAKRICITVDDCKNQKYLYLVFELSQSLEVPITFFPSGYALKDEDAELWRAVIDAGCEIGCHAYAHDPLPQMTTRGMVQTLLRSQERLDAVLGFHYGMQVMRPPYGSLQSDTMPRSTVLSMIEHAGFQKVVLWDVSNTDPDACMKHVQNGSILLFHAEKADYNCLVEVLPQLREAGYEFVTVSEMLGLPENEISSTPYVRGQ